MGDTPQDASENDALTGWVYVNPGLLVGVIGAVVTYAWIFLVLAAPAFTFFQGASDISMFIGVLSFLVGVCIGCLLVWCFSELLGRMPWLHYLLCVGCWAVGAIGLLFPKTLTLSIVFSVVCGCGYGFIYVLYGGFISSYFKDHLRPLVAGVLFAASLVCAGILFVDQSYRLAFSYLLPVISLAILAFEVVYLRKSKPPVVSKRDSDQRLHVSWRSYANTTASSLATGLGAGCIIATLTVLSYRHMVIIAMIALISLIALYDSLHGERVNETVTMRMFLPVAAVVIFPVMFVPFEFTFLFAGLAMCFALFPLISSISAILRHITICNLSAGRAFSFGRLWSFVGITVGLSMGFVGFSPALVAEYGVVLRDAVVVIFMIVEIFSTSFVMTQDNYPYDSRIRTTETGETVVMSTDLPEHDIIAPPGESQAAAMGYDHPHLFQLRCDKVAEEYGLSRRQREVLEMLAKGRNAEYITDKLVISAHTAKAHIYNIYQKTGVHSRQELMDLVEDVEVEEIPEWLD